MGTFRKIIDGIVYASFGCFSIYCAWNLRNVDNPSLLTVLALFIMGVILIAFGARSFQNGRVSR